MTAALLYPFILVAGALQAIGNAMNAQLRGRMVNPWLAATVSFLPIVFVFTTLFLTMPTPLPSLDSLGKMPWYAPLGGLAGAVAVFGGLAFIDKVGAGPFNGLTLTANILTSLAMDALGLFGLQAAGFKPMPWLGGTVSFVPVVFVFALMFLLRPSPLPTRDDVAGVRWWMPLAGLTGAVAVFAGLLFVDKVGAGAFNGLLITANLLTSVALDHFGWFGMKRVKAGPPRLVGAPRMVGGIVLISLF